MRTSGSGMGRRIVFSENPGAILGAKDEDCLDGKKGHSGSHCGGLVDLML